MTELGRPADRVEDGCTDRGPGPSGATAARMLARRQDGPLRRRMAPFHPVGLQEQHDLRSRG